MFCKHALGLIHNQLTTLPPELGNLINLQYLYLDHNQLRTLPAELGNLINLQSLGLIHNQLTTLPPELGNLTNLETLDLENNQFRFFPPALVKLINLKWLSLENNQLSTIPIELRDFLINLQCTGYLTLRGNPLANLYLIPHNRHQFNRLQITVKKLLNFLHRHRRLIFSSLSFLILLSIRSSILANLKRISSKILKHL